jgi:hypothetical protein
MAKIIIQLPQLTDLELTLPNDKLETVSEYYGIRKDDYDAPLDALQAFRDQLVRVLKKPLVRGRARELSASPDVSDLITVS